MHKVEASKKNNGQKDMKQETAPVKISVITPVYNAQDHLKQCLESVLGQSFGEFELICIDDGSSDSSIEILKSYQSKDKRIKIIEKSHTNTSDSRNAGIDTAMGEFLAFVDADDFIEPDMLEKAYSAIIETESDIAWFRSNMWEHNNREFIDSPWTLRDWEMPPFRPFSVWEASEKVFNMGSCTPWDKLFRKSFIDRENIRFQSISSCDDMLFTFGALALAHGITTLNDTLYHMRIGQSRYLAENVENTVSNYYNALSGLKDFLETHGLYEECRKSFLNWAADFSLWFYNQYRIPLLHGFIGQNLKRCHFPKLGVYDLPEEDYYNHDFFLQVQDIRNSYLSDLEQLSKPDMPQVTVIVPVLNAGDVLESCLDRLVLQTLNNIEILIVNDGSNDNSSEIIEKYAASDSRITVINNKETKGHGVAVNMGIKEAKAPYISIVEPFDTFDVALLERLFNPVIEHDLDFAKGDIASLKHDKYGNLQIDYRMLALHEHNYNRVIDSSNERIWKDFMHSPYCAVYKKSFLEENEIFFDESEDATFTDEEFVFKTDIYARRVMYVLETLYYDIQKSYLFSGYPMTELLSG